ncbi:MAG: MFS transporter [Armatimonadetes bacterium]|nr:MFS transporter [Armatimonadota bacterium]
MSVAVNPFSPLRHRNYRLFWTGQMISLIGTWVQSVAQGWLIVQIIDPGRGTPETHALANWYLGVVGAAGGLPILFGALVGGAVADRVEKRRLIMITQTILMCCALTLATLTHFGWIRIWHVIAVAVVHGCATAFDLPTRQSFIIEMVGREDLPSAVALNSGMFNSARIIGPAITGALLAAHVSIALCFLINAFSFLAVIIGLSRMRLKSVRRKVTGGVRDTLVAGLGHVRRSSGVRRILWIVASFGAFAFSFNVLLPTFIKYTVLPNSPMSQQAAGYGGLESVRGLGALTGAMLVATLARRGQQRTLLKIGAVGALTGLLVFSFMRTIPLAYGVMAFVSFCFVLSLSSCNTLVQLQTPDEMRGRVMSVYVLFNSGTGPIGSMLAGIIASNVGVPIALRIGVALTATGILTGLAYEGWKARNRTAGSTPA